MTPQERAEKIVDRHRGQSGWTRESSIADVASEIQAAVDEARAGHHCSETSLKCVEKARYDAYEEAAKIADKYTIDRYTSDTAVEVENIANEIRSRAKELTGPKDEELK